MFGKPGRPPEDRLARRRGIWAAVGRLIEQHGVRSVTMRQAASAAYISIGGLYHYFPTKGSLVLFGMDQDVLESDCAEFFPRYGRLKESDPPAATEAVVQFLARQATFIRPALLAALELGGAGHLPSQLETIMDRGDGLIESVVRSLPGGNDHRDLRMVCRSIRRIMFAGLLDRSMTQQDLEEELRVVLDGVPASRRVSEAVASAS